MTPLVEPLPSPTISPETVPIELYRRHLGLPAGAELDDRLVELIKQSRDWYSQHGQPWRTASQIKLAGIDGDTIVLDHGMKLRSALLAKGFIRAGVQTLIVVAATAGASVDRRIDELWKSDRPDEAMFLNAYAISVVEQLRAKAAEHLRDSHAARGLAVLPHYSPGYEGWDLSDHVALFRVIFGESAASAVPIRLLASGGLQPAKSIVAAYGVTDRNDLNDIRGNFWANGMGDSLTSVRAKPQYAYPAKTLTLWRDKRLQLTACGAREIRARFRFDGSTCTNFGVPIEMDYHVDLERDAANGYRIVDCSCRPADGDVGFRSTCAYLDDPELHAEQVQSYRPLIGTPLGDVLSWSPSTSPAGCLCSQASQDHKWRIVLQTIHYALENHE